MTVSNYIDSLLWYNVIIHIVTVVNKCVNVDGTIFTAIYLQYLYYNIFYWTQLRKYCIGVGNKWPSCNNYTVMSNKK